MSEWIKIDEQEPYKDVKVFYWLVPKQPDECPHDSYGNAITSFGSDPFWKFCKWKCWPSLYKPTHWRPDFEPPTGESHD